MGELRAIFEIGSLASRAGVADLGRAAVTDAFRSGGAKAAAEAVESRIIGAKSAESIAAEQSAGNTARATEEAVANDATKVGRGNVIGRMAKRLLGAGAAGSLGYGASKLGSALGAGGSDGIGSGGNGGLDDVIANPGAISPAGEVKVPDIGIAPELAGMPASSENLEGGSSSAGTSRSGSDPEIVRILKQILEQEKTSTARMSQGFAEMARMQANFIRSTVSAHQAEAIEATSSGGTNSNDRGSGSLFSSAIGTIGSSMKAIAGGIGIAAIAGGVATLARDELNPGESSAAKAKKAAESAAPATANNEKGKAAQNSLEQEYKEKYGNDWPEKLVEAVFNKLKSDKGFTDTEKSDKGDAAYLLYTQIKEIYDKANDKTKRELETSIGKEIGLPADKVRSKIDVGEGFVGTIGAAATGAAVGVNVGAAHSLAFLAKAATMVNAGAHHLGASFQRGIGNGEKADQMDAAADKNANEAMGSINDWEKDRVASAKKVITPAQQALMANHSTAAAVGSFGASLAVGAGGSDAMVAPHSVASDLAKNENNKPLSDKQKTAIEYFVSNGWTQAQAEGIVANLTAESNLKTDAVGDSGAAYGIAQWHPDRQKTFEKVIGKPIKGSSLEDQLKFVNWELNNSHKSAGDHLRKTKDARDAAVSVVQNYEVSAQRFGADAIKRGNIAESIAQTYGSGSQSSPSMASTGGAASMSASEGQSSPHAGDMPTTASPAVASAGTGNVNANVTNDNRRTTVSHTSVTASSAAMPSNLAPHVT